MVYVTFNNDNSHFTSDHSCSYKYIKCPFATARKEHKTRRHMINNEDQGYQKSDKLWKLSAQMQHYKIITCKLTVFCNLSLGSMTALDDNDKSNLTSQANRNSSKSVS